jgi:hypothetical protein
MLTLRKYLKKVRNVGVWDLTRLTAMLPQYGEDGINGVVDILIDKKATELTRINALIILGDQPVTYPDGLPHIMTILEALAENAPPDLDLLCFVKVYANALKGRAEAAEVLNRFMVGTDRQQQLFKSTDAEYARGLAARHVVDQFEAEQARRMSEVVKHG